MGVGYQAWVGARVEKDVTFGVTDQGTSSIAKTMEEPESLAGEV